ncbi:hypothetical protein L873DRAFT_1941261 [Choiromyces venosus 120613-1]|uniref:Uncharacterized protein n=1 Tax=Choiromyces venosus 120613-1 TaxID=1336337 RepID=A0A3N4JB83_9PEZI|nr:hypothetical protein L873DRAFT_1941261 [Choiromyces venosus 120613-1]
MACRVIRFDCWKVCKIHGLGSLRLVFLFSWGNSGCGHPGELGFLFCKVIVAQGLANSARSVCMYQNSFFLSTVLVSKFNRIKIYSQAASSKLQYCLSNLIQSIASGTFQDCYGRHSVRAIMSRLSNTVPIMPHQQFHSPFFLLGWDILPNPPTPLPTPPSYLHQ